MARQTRWGERLDAEPGTMFTMDFQDSDRDGVDDRMQRGPGQPKGEVGQDYQGGGNNGNQPTNNATRPSLEWGTTSVNVPSVDPGFGVNPNATRPAVDPQFGVNPNSGASQGFNRNTSTREAGGTTTRSDASPGTGSNPGTNQMQNGYIGFSDIMKQFFNWSPESHDDEGRAMKNAMMGDWVSKFFDSNLSKSMGEYQAGLSKDMMTHQWNLEQMGQSNSRKEEFGYGMRAMDKQYELQNQFANQQYGRDIGMLAATGEQTRKNYAAQGVQNRLQTITEGEQNRLYRATEGDQTRMTARVLGQEERANIDKRGENERAQTRTAGEQERLNIGARGDQERKTIDFSDNIDARKESRQRGRARALARSF